MHKSKINLVVVKLLSVRSEPWDFWVSFHLYHWTFHVIRYIWKVFFMNSKNFKWLRKLFMNTFKIKQSPTKDYELFLDRLHASMLKWKFPLTLRSSFWKTLLLCILRLQDKLLNYYHLQNLTESKSSWYQTTIKNTRNKYYADSVRSHCFKKTNTTILCKKKRKYLLQEGSEESQKINRWIMKFILGNGKKPRGFRRVGEAEPQEKFHSPLLPLGSPPTIYVPVILAQDLNSQGKASGWVRLNHVVLWE